MDELLNIIILIIIIIYIIKFSFIIHLTFQNYNKILEMKQENIKIKSELLKNKLKVKEEKQLKAKQKEEQSKAKEELLLYTKCSCCLIKKILILCEYCGRNHCNTCGIHPHKCYEYAMMQQRGLFE
uniref:Uncharacterized protein n=1 Tax=viral metagenome TaxID=1070528 RepID=A0A6C0LFT1_9ZZZZ